MKKLLALLLTIVMCVGSLAGCGKSSSTANSGTAEKPDVVEIGIPKITESFDFYNTTNGYESISMEQVYDTLVKKDDTGKTVPSLAESFTISDDSKTYTFKLRKGVKFSNGEELKASDVKFSIDQCIKSDYVSWIYEPVVDSCNVVDDYTVEIKLKNPSVSFMEYLTNSYYCAILNEKAVTEYGDTYGTTPETTVGTGPYILSEFKPGESCTYKANEDYFLGAPSIKNVVLKTIADSNTAIIALQNGEIQAYFDNIPGVSYSTVQSASSLNMVTYASTTYFETIMNCSAGIFSDPKMRLAVAYAVDRNSMLSVGAEGQGNVAAYPGNRQSETIGDPKLGDIWYQVDLDKAKALVSEAGKTGEKVVIKTYATDPYPKLATILQDALTSIGLSAEVLQMERGAFIDEVLGKGDYDIAICRWAAATKDMDEIMYGSLATASIGAPGNWSFYSNTKMDDLLTQAQGENDSAARTVLYQQAIDLFIQDVPQIPLYYPNGSRAYTKQLTIKDGNVEYDRIYDYSFAE